MTDKKRNYNETEFTPAAININVNIEGSLDDIYASPHFTSEQKAELTFIAFGLKKPKSLSKDIKCKLIGKIAADPSINKQKKKNLISEFVEEAPPAETKPKVLGTFKFNFPTSNFDSLTLDSFFADEKIKD